MTASEDNGCHVSVCAKCGTPIIDGHAELVMATHGRMWIVCRPCAKAGLRAAELGEPERATQRSMPSSS